MIKFIHKIYLTLFIVLGVSMRFGQDAPVLVPILTAIEAGIKNMDKAQMAEMAKEYDLSKRQLVVMEKIYTNAKKMKNVYDKLDIKSMKELYALYKSYACVASKFELLVSIAEKGDCVFEFDVDMALLKFEASQEIIGGLSVVKTTVKLIQEGKDDAQVDAKFSQGEQLSLFEKAVRLLKESFDELNALNKKMELSIMDKIVPNNYYRTIDYIPDSRFLSVELNLYGEADNNNKLSAPKSFVIDKNFAEQGINNAENANSSFGVDAKSDELYQNIENKKQIAENDMNDNFWLSKLMNWVVYILVLVAGVYAVFGFVYNENDKNKRLIYFGVVILLAGLYAMYMEII